MASGAEPGTLFLVGTPIGNLGDITLRAVQTLRAADCIAAEDTRRTRALLTHLEISRKPLVSLDANASPRRIESLLERIQTGQSVAFVTDAGMPGVSDPGAALVRAAVARALVVQVIPGPSAVSTAVALSGLVDAPYRFAGFLPRQGGKRADAIERVALSTEPVVLFEAPGRTGKTLADLALRMPDRAAVVCRELTKAHEEAVRGSLRELSAEPREWRGEICIVLGPGSEEARAESDEELDARIVKLVREKGSTKDIVGLLKQSSSLSRRELYARVEKARREEIE
jgi:16S rRNA (cytidine1402-2'-O)-methyltransferase